MSLADVNLTVECVPLFHITQADYPSECTKPSVGSAHRAGRMRHLCLGEERWVGSDHGEGRTGWSCPEVEGQVAVSTGRC